MALGELQGDSTSAPAGARKPLGNLAEAQHRKHLRSAKIAIGFVGVLTIGINGFFLSMLEENRAKFEKDVAAALANPAMSVDQAKVAQARLELGQARSQCIAFVAVGAVFVALIFFINTYPYGATASALALYIIANVVGMSLNPEGAAHGIIVKIIIVYVLYRSVKSGMEIRKMREQEAAAVAPAAV